MRKTEVEREKYKKHIIENESKSGIREENLFSFNPNNISRADWEKMGLDKHLIDVIENYKESGGTFYNKEDLKKIYGLDERIYSRLEPYIVLDQSEREETSEEKTSQRTDLSDSIHSIEDVHEKKVLDLNRADTVNLLMVHGIGPAYARRICKYRGLLGGYSELKQLKEVYGINDSVYNHIKNSLNIDTTAIEKIDLNKAEFKELIRHPYVSAYQTKAILKYRKFKGKIGDKKELLENNILDEQTYQKVGIYLKP